MIACGVWTLVLAGVAWADWRTRSLSWGTLIAMTVLTLGWFPPWRTPGAWLAASAIFAGSAGYVAGYRRCHPHTVVWGLADYWVAALTVLWLQPHIGWIFGMILGAFAVQLLASTGIWMATRRLPSQWPWLVGFFVAWTWLHAVPGVHGWQ